MSSLEDFLDELEDLTNKYGIEIGGCGDCGSPWVTGNADDINLGWVDDHYVVGYSGEIRSKSGRVMPAPTGT